MRCIEQHQEGSRFLYQLDQQIQHKLFSNGVLTQFERNQFIIKEGSQGSKLHFLVNGSVKVIRHGKNRKVCLSILQSGDFFGELSMIDEGNTSADIITTSKCEVLSLDRDTIYAFLQTNPFFLQQFLTYISSKLRQSIDSVCSIALDDVYGRVRKVLIRLTQDGSEQRRIVSITHTELAEMVGSSREMVSIIIKELRLGDYLRTGGRSITLLKNLPEHR